jgi:hypothetical protein
MQVGLPSRRPLRARPPPPGRRTRRCLATFSAPLPHPPPHVCTTSVRRPAPPPLVSHVCACAFVRAATTGVTAARLQMAREVTTHAMHTLFNLCRVNHPRQNQAAEYGIIPALQNVRGERVRAVCS